MKRKLSRLKQITPCMGMIEYMIKFTIAIWKIQNTYNGMWDRVNHIESELIRLYCIKNEECIRP